MDIVDEDIPTTPCQQCQNVPSTTQVVAPVMQNNLVEANVTPQQIDKTLARWTTTKEAYWFGRPGFTPLKRFNVKLIPTPLRKEIPPIEQDMPTPIKCMRAPSPRITLHIYKIK